MSPIDYLRGVVTRERTTPAAADPPLPTLTWANAMTVLGAGTCVHEVIYSRCYCNLRKQTVQNS